MSDIDPGDVVLVKTKFLMGTEKIMNTHHFRHEGVVGLDVGDWITGCNSYMQGLYNGLNNLLSDEWSTDTIEHYNLTQDLPLDERAWPTPLTGTQVEQSLPYQNAMLLTFPTQAKRSLGKKYIAGLHEGESSAAGALKGTMITALETFVVTYLVGFTSAGQGSVPGNYRKLISAFIPYVSGIVETLVSSQRRRKPGVGQ